MECDQGVYHGCHCNQGKKTSGNPTNTVAEVEEPDGKTAEDNGEVEPGEESTFVGEEDLGFDAGREGDALS